MPFMQKPVIDYKANIGTSVRATIERDPVFRSVAYFSMEIGLEKRIPTYSGGLGILAGDILKSAADLGVPMIGITLLYRNGYFLQDIDADGNQKEAPVFWDPNERLIELPNEVEVQIEGRYVKIHAWCYEIIGESDYPLPVYFLDTDVEGNSPADRQITGFLYGGDLRYRLCQELVFGVGGLRMLRDLGYRNIRTYHLNEGHAGFLTLELLREQGYESYDKIREQVVFTTHTPVPAGHDHFPYEMIERVMEPVFVGNLKRMMGPEGVSMTELGFRYSRYANGVSSKHAEVSRNLFNQPHLDAITNGVHSKTWTSPIFAKLYDRHLPQWRYDPSHFLQAASIPDEEIWKAHQAAKLKLFEQVLEDTGRELDPDVLTIGFARRFAAYKRADFLFADTKRLIDICSGKAQFIFSGKAHPNDEPGKELIRRIFAYAKEIGAIVPIVFLKEYDMELAALLTSGVDVWLNTPVRPREASGTSGMKCAHNGVLNFSILDGWWIEGWQEDVTGWSIGAEPSEAERPDYNEAIDVDDLYSKLEDKIIPTYYHHRDRWVSMMKNAIALNAAYFNTHRVVREYCEKAYGVLFRGF